MAEKLGDVIGVMLADVARARVRADVEAMRIAEAYSHDPLLKHLTVPRFRMPELVVDLPVLISGVDASAEPGDAWKVSKPTKAEIAQAVRDGLSGSEIRLSKTQSTAVIDAVSKRSVELFAKDDSSNSPGSVADVLAAETVTGVKARLKKDPKGEQLEVLSRSVKSSMSSLLAAKLKPSPSTEVIFASEEIKAYGDNANIVRLRLTISEDSYEVVERDDGQGYYLAPE